MPRVENVGENVTAWWTANNGNEGSSVHDVCKACAKVLDKDPHAHDEELVPYGHNEPQGDEGWFEGPEHPYGYEDEDYYCEVCGEDLGEEDN